MTSTASSRDPLTLVGDLAPLVPDDHAAYRPVVAEALSVFLEHIPQSRRTRLLDAQLGLPATATVEQRLVTLMHACPTLHKLGQVVARHRSLSPALRRELQRLESLEPHTPIAEIRGVIGAAIPGVVRQSIHLDAEPLAEASVASVVGFSWQYDAYAPPKRGVFKVLKPGVALALEEELEALSQVGAFLDDATQRHGLPALDYRETFDSVRELLVREVRFEHEQANIEEARQALSGLPGVRVPELFPFCTPRVTAMERIDGLPLSSLLGASDPHLRHIAGRIVEGLIARPLLDPAPCAMFHADPHAGNLMVTDDGDLVAIDWSLVGRLSKEARVQTVQLLLGGWTVHRARMLGAIDALALTAGDPQRVGDVVDDALGCIRTGGFAGLAWLVRLLDELVVRAGVRFNRDLLMFRKALLTLTGVLADLDATFPIDAELFRVVTSQLAREWSERFWSDPFSRAFDLPLSNVDLMDACMAFPALAATTWMNTWRSTGHYS